MKRGLTLVEVLIVLGIIVILAGLLFPVFARSKEQSKLTRCQTRLHQLSLALQMYRGDHDGLACYNYSDQKGGYSTAGRYRYPWNNWLPLESYLKDGAGVWCLEPARDQISTWNLYSQRTWTLPGLHSEKTMVIRSFFEPEGSLVIAYCGNHQSNELEKKLEPMIGGVQSYNKGFYPYVREDGSTGLAKSAELLVSYLWESDHRWHDAPERYAYASFVFPGESWPPSGSFDGRIPRIDD